jgi:light-regulated signal transduction histidine kinase (bacteriophytochrome)
MPSFEDISRLCPLPIVNLVDIAAPTPGVMVDVPTTCVRNFPKSDACREHYQRIGATADLNTFVQCPFGFSSFVIRTKTSHVAVTCIVPYPRMGGVQERDVAKRHPDTKMRREAVEAVEASLVRLEDRMAAMENEVTKRHSVALHEIRKLNRNVKQEAERLCTRFAPNNPDGADPQLVKIWKSAELMSLQFDAIELLANESLAQLPLNSSIEVYRIVDKCVRIYRPPTDPQRIVLHPCVFGYTPRIRACDKTFHMIPTVFIENALKYSLHDTVVDIDIRREGQFCALRVTNTATYRAGLNDSVFQKGVRFASEVVEGSGNGLYLAKLVAEQHKALMSVSTRQLDAKRMKCTFTLLLPEIL